MSRFPPTVNSWVTVGDRPHGTVVNGLFARGVAYENDSCQCECLKELNMWPFGKIERKTVKMPLSFLDDPAATESMTIDFEAVGNPDGLCRFFYATYSYPGGEASFEDYEKLRKLLREVEGAHVDVESPAKVTLSAEVDHLMADNGIFAVNGNEFTVLVSLVLFVGIYRLQLCF